MLGFFNYLIFCVCYRCLFVCLFCLFRFFYGHMVSNITKDHSDSERGNPLSLLYGLLFPISNKMDNLNDRIAHTTAYDTPVSEHWLVREINQWVHCEGSIRRTHRTKNERSYYGATSRSLSLNKTFPSFVPSAKVVLRKEQC